MIDDHEMLKRAATECICNLVLNEEVLASSGFFIEEIRSGWVFKKLNE